MTRLDIKKSFIELLTNKYGEEYINDRILNMINRYLNFVSFYQKNIVNKYVVGYCENHHIMPRSLYPEYASLKVNKWNSVIFPIRAHYIAHYMLYVIFKDEMRHAMYMMMCSLSDSIKNGIPENNIIRCSKLYESARSDYYDFRTNHKYYFHQNSEKYGFLHPENDKELIEELNLRAYAGTDKQKKQLVDFSKAATQANLGTKVYNNGTIQKKFKPDDIIPEGFVKGGLKRNLIKGHSSIINWSGDDGKKIVVGLYVEYDGNTEMIADKIGISITNLLKNIRRHMPELDRISYLPNHIRYTKDRKFAMELYNLFDGDFDCLGEYLGLKSSSVSSYYNRKYIND